MYKNKITFKLIEPLLLFDDKIEGHIENLHKIMFHWLTFENMNKHDDEMFSVSETYRDLRNLLQKLKPIEKERDLYWKKRRAGIVVDNYDYEENQIEDYKEKYLKALEEIESLKESNNRIKNILN